MRITIEGNPVSQKNSRAFNRGKNPRVKAWHAEAEFQLRSQWGAMEPIRESGIVIVAYQQSQRVIDIDNICAAPLDALEKAGVIVNDKHINPLVAIRKIDKDRPRYEIVFVPAGELMRLGEGL